MGPHPELIYWTKCPTCGYCEFDLELIAADKRDKAIENKLAKKPEFMVNSISPVKPKN